MGWKKISDEISGHLFEEQEVPIVLKEHGYTNISSEVDKIGSLYMVAAGPPFGSPGKMVKLLLVTVLFFVLLYFILQLGILEMLFYM